MYLKLAWRNIWRNRSRTLITMAAVFLAVILSTLMMSMKEGVYVGMIDSMVGSYTGYAQVHASGYWEEQSIDNSFQFDEDLRQLLNNQKGIKGYAPRLEGFALSASENMTKGAMIVGVDPELELAHTQLNERVVEGDYLSKDDNGVLIGKGLAHSLELSVGDTIVALGQGYHGASAAGKYPVKGIVKFGSPELSKRLIILPMKEAQSFFGTENLYSSLILLFEDNSEAVSIVQDLKGQMAEHYEVMDWTELLPELVSMIETDRVEGYVFMFILYMVISFGIFGTVLMMLSERKHEFGVMVAIGMKKFKLSIVVWLEVMVISIAGALIGMIGAFPVCYYFHLYPIRFGEDLQKMMEDYGMEAIIQSSVAPEIFTSQAIIVAIIASMIALYPLISINNMRAINAMRS